MFDPLRIHVLLNMLGDGGSTDSLADDPADALKSEDLVERVSEGLVLQQVDVSP